MEYSMETVIKRAFHVQIGSRMILRSKKKNKISTNYSLRSLLPIQFHERNSWTECTFFFFSSQLWSTGARLSKSVSLTPVRFDPLSSSLSDSLSDRKSFSAIDLVCKERFIGQTSAKQCLHCSISSIIERNPVSLLSDRVNRDVLIVRKIEKQTNRFTRYLYFFFRFPVG